MGLAALCFSLMGVFIKFLGSDALALPAAEIVFWRSSLGAVLTICVMPKTRQNLLGNRTGLLVVRGLMGFLGLQLYVMALGRIPYPTAAALQYTHPVFTAIFAALLLRERLPRGGILAMIVCLGGAMLILRPDGSTDLTGSLLALGSGIAAGMAYTLVRGLSRSESTFTIVLSFHVMASLVAGLLMIPDFIMPQGIQWLWILCVMLLSQAGQVFLTKGLTREKAGTATTVSYLSVVFSAILGWLLFQEVLGLGMGLGCLCIVLGLYLISRARRAQAKLSA